MTIEIDASAVNRFAADMLRVARALRGLGPFARIDVDVDLDETTRGGTVSFHPRLRKLEVST